MSPAVTNFLFEVANFAVLAALLGWVLFKPVRRALDLERERHNTEGEQIRGMRVDAERLAEESRAARLRVDSKAAEQSEQLLAAARREAAQIKEDAERTRAADRERFQSELESVSRRQADALAQTLGQIAAASVQRLLSSVDAPTLDRGLLREAIVEIGKMPGGGRAEATVESARPLDAESRKLLESLLEQTITERVVAELGAGVRVTMVGGQVDASARAIARHAAREVAFHSGSEPAEEPDAS